MHIQVKNLTFSYQIPGYQSKPVLTNVSLEIHPAEIVGIIGLSGSGKSTLMHHFTGLLKPDQGKVLVNSQNLWDKNTDLAKVRQQVGLVFQFPEKQLFRETVFEDISVGPENLDITNDETIERVHSAMQAVGLDVAKYKTTSPLNLSYGEKRRVAIAGILALNPACLMLDEPTAGLDPAGVKLINKIISDFKASKKTVVVISHNIDFVLTIATRIVILHDGAIHFDGLKDTVMATPKIITEIGFPIPKIIALTKHLKRAGYLKTEKIYSLEKIKEHIAL